jgi:hypothetical protein
MLWRVQGRGYKERLQLFAIDEKRFVQATRNRTANVLRRAALQQRAVQTTANRAARRRAASSRGAAPRRAPRHAVMRGVAAGASEG